MKRSDALIELSHDHHSSLVHVSRIKLGIRNCVDPKRIAAYISWFFKQELATHFEEEETQIFIFLEPNHPLKLQALAEHEESISLAETIDRSPQIQSISLYAHVLEAHIRFEERELFEYLQIFCGKELNKYNGQQHTYRLNKTHGTWKDTFWKEQ